MKLLPLLAGVPLLVFTGGAAADDKPKPKAPDCVPVATRLAEEIAAKPSRVLMAVEDALTSSEACACEIVRTAIESTKADPRLTGDIVFTAVTSAPGMAATIVECAVATAPHAAASIKAAMSKAAGDDENPTSGSGKGPVSGKESGKAPSGKEVGKAPAAVPDELVTEDFGFSSLGVGGIYLITPGGQRTVIVEDEDDDEEDKPRRRRPRREVPDDVTEAEMVPGDGYGDGDGDGDGDGGKKKVDPPLPE